MEEEPQTYNPYLVATVILFLLLVLIGGFYFLTYQTLHSKTNSSIGLTSPTPVHALRTVPFSPPSQPTPVPPPSVSFSNYELKTGLPSVPSSLTLYTLKTTFRDDEISTFASSKFGLSEKQPTTNPKEQIYSNMNDMYKRGYLIMNNETGAFTFTSYGIVKPDLSIKGESPLTTASSYLAYLFPKDTTLTCTNTYQKKETQTQNITYVECHRDWNKVGGIPILNPIGVLNIPEDKKLSASLLGTTDANTPADLSIVNASNGTDGKTRPNDFNTVTFAVATDATTRDNRILSVDSNLRWIDTVTSLAKADLVTPEEALSSFTSHSSDFPFTIPAGTGSVDWSKVYKDNKGIAKTATITDYLLTYLEKPQGSAQSYLTPTYIIRGVATLDTGYTVRFIETLPATRQGLSFLNSDRTRNGGQVAGVSSVSNESDRGQKQGTFFQNTPMPTPSPTTIPGQPTPTSPPLPQTTCKLTLIIITLPGIGKVGYNNEGGQNAPNHTYYYIPDSNTDLSSLNLTSMITIFDNLGVEQMDISYSKIIKNFGRMDINGKNISSKDLAAILIPGVTYTGSATNNYAFFDANISDFLASLTQGSTVDSAKNAISTQNNVRGKEILKKSFIQFQDIVTTGKLEEWAAKNDMFPNEARVFFLALFAPYQNGESPNPENGCIYLSGASPSLYFYPQKRMNITVTSSLIPFTYTYPSKDTWNITTDPNGSIISSNQTLSRLYYEYDKERVQFTVKNGRVVKNNVRDVEKNIRESALQLKLNKNETEDLLTDVRNALPDIKGDYVKLSIANSDEVNTKLPFSIYPKPDHFYRIHFLLSPSTSSEYLKSKILPNESFAPVVRDGFTVVEVGARSY